jgi:hypothetical protein
MDGSLSCTTCEPSGLSLPELSHQGIGLVIHWFRVLESSSGRLSIRLNPFRLPSIEPNDETRSKRNPFGILSWFAREGSHIPGSGLFERNPNPHVKSTVECHSSGYGDVLPLGEIGSDAMAYIRKLDLDKSNRGSRPRLVE